MMRRSVYAMVDVSTGELTGIWEADSEPTLVPQVPEIMVDPNDETQGFTPDPNQRVVRVVDSGGQRVMQSSTVDERALALLRARSIRRIEWGEATELFPNTDIDAIAAEYGVDAIHPITGEPTKIIPVRAIANAGVLRKRDAQEIVEKFELETTPYDVHTDQESTSFPGVTRSLTLEQKQLIKRRINETDLDTYEEQYFVALRRKTP